MIDFARLPVEKRTPYFQEVANRRGLTRLIVEKDFWVCFALQLLFSVPELADRLVFKGGTSLSKVFGIVKRLSEDIDLSVDPDWLGFGGDDRPDAAGSRSQFEKRWRRLNAACTEAVEQQVQPALEQAIQAALGFNRGDDPYLSFKLEEETHSPVLTFRYPTVASDPLGYVCPQVRLELGSLTDQRPVGKHTLTPWVAEEFPDLFDGPVCRVVVLQVERTFWEKVTILHAEHHRPADKPMRARLSRDCYDVCRMAVHPAGVQAMQDLDLLARVVKHKRTYFRCSWADYDTAVPGTLRLVPPKQRLPGLRSDYRQMQEMFTETPPPFDEILAELQRIEDMLNGR